MKKTLILLSIITFISFYAKAQDDEPKEYVKSYLTLLGGFSYAKGDFAQATYENYKAGFAKRGAAVAIESGIYLYKNLGFGVQLSFQDQGELTANDVQTLANGYNNTLKVNSTLVQGVDRYHSLNLLAGPQYSFTYGKFILDLRAQAGIAKSLSTPSLLIYVSGSGSTQTINQNSSKGSDFAYGGHAALRWQFAEGWDIGLHFNYVEVPGIKISTSPTDYQAMKERTAAQFASGGIPEYADAKEPWFDQAFAEMERWAARTDWRP